MRYIPLSEVCEINMGQSPDSSSYNKNGDGLPFFQGNADFGEKYPVTRVWCNNPTKIAHAEDILISVRAPIGAMNYASEDCCIGRGLAALTPDKGCVSPEFIYWLLKGKSVELNSKGTGSTFKAISRKVLEEVRVPDISLREQKLFAVTLEKVYKIIQSRKKQLSVYDILIKARFVEMFGDMADPFCKWPICRLIDACESNDDIKCGPFGTQLSKDEYQDSGVPVWEIPQINSSFDIPPEHFLSIEKAEQLRAYSLSYGDIVMSRKGNVGKCALFPADKSSGILHSDVLRIRVSTSKANPCFVMCQLHFSRDVLRQIEQVSSGAIMAGVNVTKLKDVIIKLPPLELQEQFAFFVSKIDKSKVFVKKALDEAQLLFDSLMQQYFG